MANGWRGRILHCVGSNGYSGRALCGRKVDLKFLFPKDVATCKDCLWHEQEKLERRCAEGRERLRRMGVKRIRKNNS